jgi:hypothetical protein
MPTRRELYEQCTQEEKDELFMLVLLCIQAREKGSNESVSSLARRLGDAQPSKRGVRVGGDLASGSAARSAYALPIGSD